MQISLTVDKLGRLRKHDFERFLRALLDADYRARFAKGAVAIDGPSSEDEGDGGYDVDATVKEPALVGAYDPVLRGDRGGTMYSCKSHKAAPKGSAAPKGWLQQVRDNIDPTPRVWDARKATRTDPQPAKLRDKTPPGLTDILHRLVAGDEFCVAVNVEVGNRTKYAQEFATRFHVRAGLLGLDGEVREGQVRVLGAQELVNAFNERPVALDADLVAKLGGPDDDFLLSWDRWTNDMEAQRRRMTFVSDERRNELNGRMQEVLDDPGPSVLWVIGAPGVGKTRAVHEFFDRIPALRRRVVATEDWPALLEWCSRADDIEADLIVVADEVPADRAHDLWRKFRGRASKTGATLVMIGTKSGEGGGAPQPFELEVVEPSRFRTLIEAEYDARSVGTGDRARTIALVEGLAQGYPLFAMWLTRGLAENPELLEDPGGDLTDNEDPWTATRLVLANRTADSDRWQEVADLRGRSLLLALLAPDEGIALSADDERALADGLGQSWPQLAKAQLECRERGILRATRYGHVYVSPANLERLILNHYFGRSPPPIDPKRLRDRVGDRMDRLLERARSVDACDACRRALALASVEARLADVERGSAPADALLWVAAEVPRVVVEPAHSLARRVGAGELPASAAPLSQVLGHLRHRELSEREFALVEDGLFALAYEHGTKVRPGPANDWTSLFSSGLHATHQSFDFRLSLLRRRLEASDRDERLAAVDGAARACNPNAGGLALNTGLDDRDKPQAGEWLGPRSEAECVRRAARGWELLLGAANDGDPEVADRARRTIAEQLRSGFRVVFPSRVDLVEKLRTDTAGWTASQRNALGSGLEDVNRYDREHFATSTELVAAIDALVTSLAPVSLADRVMAQVGRWNPLPGPIAGTQRMDAEHRADLDVARAVLDDPGVLWRLADWLDSAEALRVSPFGFALGEADRQRVLLTGLLERVRASSLVALTASYLAAWADKDGAAFDRWLPNALPDTRLDDAVARALCASTATEARIDALRRMVERGGVDPASLRGIGYWDWAAAVDRASLDELIRVLVRDGHREMLWQAIGLARQRLDKARLDGSLEGVLVELVDATRSGHLAATGESDWARLVVVLLQAGRPQVLQSVVRALDDEGYSHQARRAMVELQAAGEADALWEALLAALGDAPLRVILLDRMLSDAQLQIPPSRTLAWVGADPDRGATAARLARPYGSELDPLARELLTRFGADSAPARALRARAMSTPTVVHSFAAFFDQQAHNAETWATECGGQVAVWAAGLAVDLRERAAAEREDETLWRRHG